ncbi:protein of unknown function [Candidatus Hydrogenisulfobacillus filiaventi]|uniref:Uncharacterized protein n=1 Tax=Candidatus Hydrogenisulfobacillus filiaventi TaxID=2707344 RepID=A0A6F8ZKS3_9FIRM|nr:protein of unknown function [Candidatus Hydrogenisulfobacillus filiaventi]
MLAAVLISRADTLVASRCDTSRPHGDPLREDGQDPNTFLLHRFQRAPDPVLARRRSSRTSAGRPWIPTAYASLAAAGRPALCSQRVGKGQASPTPLRSVTPLQIPSPGAVPGPDCGRPNRPARRNPRQRLPQGGVRIRIRA